MKIDDIQSFPVRPLLQPAIEQLAPNEWWPFISTRKDR
jgi:hypothetical protein